MRWWTWRVGAAVLLGVVTTVAVAWGLARWGRVGGGGYSMVMMEAEGRAWMYAVEEGAGIRRVRSAACGGIVLDAGSAAGLEGGAWEVRRHGAERVAVLAAEGVPPEVMMLHGWVDDSAGWPMVAMRAQTRVRETPGGPRVEGVAWGVELAGLATMRMWMPRMWVLPLRPVWPGFVVDAGVYGVGWFGVLVGPGVFRRWRRGRGGLCVGCGYDLRGGVGGGCPECGLGRGGNAA